MASPEAKAAFIRANNRNPGKDEDLVWMEGYDFCRGDIINPMLQYPVLCDCTPRERDSGHKIGCPNA